MKVIWTPEAEQDRAHIWGTIVAENPRAAEKMDRLFSDAAARLAGQPFMGQAGKISGTREWIPHKSYRLVYEVSADVLWILALVHTSRLWPSVAE